MSTPDTFNHYDLLDLIRLPATFLNLASVPADPSTIMLLTANPLGTVATYVFGVASITRVPTGAYYFDLVGNVAGTWHYRWHGTGGVTSNEEWGFIVDRSFIL